MDARHPEQTLVAALAALACILAQSGVAHATAAKCTAAIVKANAGFVQKRTKALQKCEDSKVRGPLPPSTVCLTEAKTAPALAKAQEKLSKSIATACGGKDRVCGGTNAADDEPLANVGWSIGSCPDFETGDCTNAITSCNDIPTCLDCIDEAALDQAMNLYYGSLQATDPTSKDKAVKALITCQATIGKAATAFVAAKSKALAKCWTIVGKAGSGTCPNAPATKVIEKAASKMAAAITRACRGADRTAGTADDPTPTAIGFPTTCLDIAPVGGSICSGAVDSLQALIDCVDCVTRFKTDCPDRAAVPAVVSPYPSECNSGIVRQECAAQRTVHVVAGTGGLAWFTLVWPVPEVIESFDSTYSYDDPAKAALIPGTASGHPLYARRIGSRTLWEGIGTAGDPSIFVVGTNQAHTTAPTTTVLSGGPAVIPAGAVLQSQLDAPLPVLMFGVGLSYGTAPGAPAAVSVANIDAAISALRAVTTISPEMEQDLRPSDATLATWGIGPSAPAVLAAFARNLLFTANAFRLGLISTVILPGFNDHLHGAFSDVAGTATPRADGLAQVLDAFYAELAAHRESKCSHGGKQLSLADNTVLVVSGDTFNDPFNRTGWPDGTPGNANLLYVRSNGYLKAGWFGVLGASTGRTSFDPTDGDASVTTSVAESTAAAQLGILFAITRGNTAAVARASAAPYAGVVGATLP